MLDNFGFEFFIDLCFVEFFLYVNFVKEIYFYIKEILWFVFDVSKKDVIWMVEEMRFLLNKCLFFLGDRWF